jgi:hypothetical protein
MNPYPLALPTLWTKPQKLELKGSVGAEPAEIFEIVRFHNSRSFRDHGFLGARFRRMQPFTPGEIPLVSEHENG